MEDMCWLDGFRCVGDMNLSGYMSLELSAAIVAIGRQDFYGKVRGACDKNARRFCMKDVRGRGRKGTDRC